MPELSEWSEPRWGAAQRRPRLDAVLLSRDFIRVLVFIVTVGGIAIAVLATIGGVAEQQIGLVIRVTLWLCGLAVVLGLLWTIFQWFPQDVRVSVSRGRMALGGGTVYSIEAGDQVALEVDDTGRRWLAVRRGSVVIRVGVAEGMSIEQVDRCLKMLTTK